VFTILHIIILSVQGQARALITSSGPVTTTDACTSTTVARALWSGSWRAPARVVSQTAAVTSRSHHSSAAAAPQIAPQGCCT